MSAIAGITGTRLQTRRPLATFVQRHPEWWALALCAAAWLSMILGVGHSHHHHHHHGGGGASRALIAWLVMTLAMMIPMTAATIRMTAQRSLWRRRHRAAAGFVLGYVGCWMLFGTAILFLPIATGARAAAVAFAVAAVWQLTRWKRLALAACHWSMPLAPRGWRADRDAVRFGWRSGLRCVVSCWLLMFACFVAGHALLATIIGTAVGLAERYVVRDQRLLAAALFGASLFYALQ